MKMKMKKTKRNRGSSVGDDIIAGLKEAVAWTQGKEVKVRVTTVHVPTIDVRSVRTKLGLSQWEFANKFGFRTATLRNWEQGRTRPDGAARVLLTVIAGNPRAVEDALRKAS